MNISETPEENVLNYTNEEIVTNWRKGMLKNIANHLILTGTAEGQTGGWYSTLAWTPGSLGEHMYSNTPNNFYTYETGDCKIISVTHLEELKMEKYDHNSFGPPTERTETGIEGIVTCNHGHTGKMTLEISVGDLIYTIANTTN